MGERMFGLETEYAVAGSEMDQRYGRGALMDGFLDVARRTLPHLRDERSSGMYLSNGSRLYVDCGNHPELSTPECTNPWDAVRYLKAGERIIDRIITQLVAQCNVGIEIVCSVCNVDYVQNTTWGCHESYLHRSNTQQLPRHVIPHLVSRIIYTGAGGFDPLSSGLRFTLSPRAAYITQATSSNSTNDRGIFHTKDESLSARGYHRLHIICGESLCSELAIWLKVGATALVVAMIEAGLQPGLGVELASPVDALRTVASDPLCRSRLELTDGRTASALEIQRHYLRLAETHVDDAFMPPWAGEVCVQWKRILELLEGDPQKVQKMLDWAIKQALYSRHIESHWMAWDTIQSWNQVAGRLEEAMDRICGRRVLRPEVILGVNSPVLEDVARLTPLVREKGLRWDGLEKYLRLMQQMIEIDTRFGQIGGNSIFRSLDRSGLLEHHVKGVDDIEKAVSIPPGGSRARIRGEVVQHLAGKGEKYRCTWFEIFDPEGKLILDLSDPFLSEEEEGERGASPGRQYVLPGMERIEKRINEILRMRIRGL